MKILSIGLTATMIAAMATPSLANDRYKTRPPVVVSPGLSSTWMLQLDGGRVQHRQTQTHRKVVRRTVAQPSRNSRQNNVHQASVRTKPVKKVAKPELSPQFLPQVVNYETNAKTGSIVIDTQSKFLYLVMGDGKARRYGVGVGKTGFEWTGSHKITRKAEWPSWRPPAEMIAREKKKGRILPAYMEGGPRNPLGARALYLGSTLYRIHGTNQPWTIGQAVSSGCIRMRNQDVVDLYERVKVGVRVTVI